MGSLSALSDSEVAKMDTSADASDTKRPRKKRAIGLTKPQDTTPISPPPPLLRDSSTRIYILRYPLLSEQTDNKLDIVKLIRKARFNDAAKADKTDKFRENLDFISFGMISESEP